ncbi:hypothetical protein RD792_016406 [Penstemon davidsonii]|uniref:tRNA-dihydrouridine(47) synthase [NAD(P)(+)] n=1 Tax=Penstemon davidsonii TaxID=160366 RepID=A0ABR0CKW4_9LAMI|nr:hypothetical protein RD792_016406 [Penstemon davidsonii]
MEDAPPNDVVPTPAMSHADMSAEELVAKAIAPVKREFRCPPPIRTSDNHNNSNADVKTTAKNDGVSAPVIKEKKSKRQLKRERREEQKSALHICPAVAKSGNVNSCQYNENCRYSHDLEAFKLQKPEDLEGKCPFLDDEGPCPYGLSCRFGSSHNYNGDVGNGKINMERKMRETNVMKKDGQAKNKKFGSNENDDQILSKGSGEVNGNGCSKVASNQVVCSAKVVEEDKQDGLDVADEQGPPKKTKCLSDETCPVQISDEQILHKICEQEDELKIIVEHDQEDKSLKLHPREKKLIDFREKLYLAPLTTVGNLPYRRVCKVLGADITCGEMAMCTNLLQGQASEWALLRRHSSEDLFGVQICGAYPDTVAKTVELIEQHCTVDFIDINMGCPIDIVCNKGAGSALLTKPMRMKSVVEASSRSVDIPLTIKVRTGYFEGKNRIDSLIADIVNWGASAVTIHGRTRQQRYSKLADWEYIYQCARAASPSLQVLGNGDVFSYLDWNIHKSDCPELSTCMIARGALVKPWIFTEIKEQRHWDISSGERLNILKDYVRFGLEHWGSDSKGVETTRHFLLEWLSYACRYVPVGLLEVIPQRINWRPPSYFGRDDLETLMASESAADWIRITEMLLGKVPSGFTFAPKHKSNAYDRAENG